METIRYVDRQYDVSWVAHDSAGEVDRIIDSCGDLVLHLRDFEDLTALQESELLHRWAEGWSFDLHGIDTELALRTLLLESIIGSLDGLGDSDLRTAVESSVVRYLRDEDNVDAPDYRVRLNGAVVRHMFTDIFDGPFERFEDLQQAMRRRCLNAPA